jgi:hypothetical protein
MRLTQSLLLLALSIPCAARAQRAPAASATPSADGYSTDSTSFVVGKRVYLRSTKTYIGRIIGAEDKHDFRDGHFRRPWAKAVLIERRDGPRDWMPVEGITRIYAVK